MLRKERLERIVAMCRQNISLEGIAEVEGVTRERIRMILNDAGYNVKDLRTPVVTADPRALREQNTQDKYGLSWDELLEAREKGWTKDWARDRRNALNRGIEWSLRLGDWLQIWQASGKMHLRGRGRDKYGLTRIDESKGYQLGNAFVQPLLNTMRKSRRKAVRNNPGEEGVYMLLAGTSRPWIAKYHRTIIGRFATKEEAIAARQQWLQGRREAGLRTGSGLGSGRGWTFNRKCTRRPYQVQVRGMKNRYFATQEEAEAGYQQMCEERRQMIEAEAARSLAR